MEFNLNQFILQLLVEMSHHYHKQFNYNLYKLSEAEQIQRFEQISKLIELVPQLYYLPTITNPTSNYLKYTKDVLEAFILQFTYGDPTNPQFNPQNAKLWQDFCKDYQNGYENMIIEAEKERLRLAEQAKAYQQSRKYVKTAQPVSFENPINYNYYLFIRELGYLSCSVQNHCEELSQVCLENGCSYNMLICPLCEQQKHRGHRSIALKQYLNELKFENGPQIFQQLIEENKKLQQIHCNLKNQISVLKNSIETQLYDLQTRINTYFNLMASKLLQTHRYSSVKFIQQSLLRIVQSSNSQELSQFIENIQLHCNLSSQSILKHYSSTVANKQIYFKQTIGKINLKQQIHKISQSFQQIKKPCLKVSYKWSQFKTPNISINDLIATQTSQSSTGGRFALMQTVQKGWSGDLKVGFRILKLKGWIGIGICLKQQIINSSYKFNYTLPKHGSYLISANGYSWSHSQTELNSAYKSFHFTEGDVVYVTYSISNKVVRFQNKLTNKTYTLTVNDPQNDDIYVPCVNLCNVGDEVEIVNDEQ